MHGEYKVPGGKLVVADVEVRDDRIAGAEVSGDFFLEPPEALAAIRDALIGAPRTATEAELAERVRAALAPGVAMIGFSPEAVATAVRRALQGRWRDYRWRLLHEEPEAPMLHMALDEVLLEEVAAGRRPPTLRIWEWAGSAVVLGRFQSVRNEVDPDGAERHGIEVVRRITGGGAMFVEPENTITYSLYAPEELVEGMSFVESYAFLDAWVLEALRSLGVEATYQPINDIASPGGKIGGAAQTRRNGAVLHHVTMAYDIDAAKMLEVLRIGREKMSDKGTKSAAKRVGPVREQTGLSRGELIERFVDTFRSLYGLEPDRATPEERAEAERRVREKFATEGWVHVLP